MSFFGFGKSKKGLPDQEATWHVKFEELEFGDEIGKGNYGVVTRGKYNGTDVAIKLIKDDSKKYLEREVKILKDVRHPNLVQLMGVCDHKGKLYLVTEYLTGGNLRKKLKKKEVDIPWYIRVKLAFEVAVAVQYLHSKDIIHRDLKSKNLLLDEHWKVKICDFGLARAIEGGGKLRRYTVCGTEEWIAPEVALGRPYGASADVYSFGIIMLEIILREKPNENAIQNSHTTGMDIGVARACVPKDSPAGFAELALRCCEADPTARPTMAEVARELKTLLANIPIPLGTPGLTRRKDSVQNMLNDGGDSDRPQSNPNNNNNAK